MEDGGQNAQGERPQGEATLAAVKRRARRAGMRDVTESGATADATRGAPPLPAEVALEPAGVHEEPPAADGGQTEAESLAERRRRRRAARQRERVAEAQGKGAPAQPNLAGARREEEAAQLEPGHARRPTAFGTPSSKMARYTPLRTLGRGTFGVASLVRDERNGRLSVLKRIECESLEEANDALAEAAALASVRSPRVLELREHLLEYDEKHGVLCVCILTDFCAGGDLSARIAAARSAGSRFSERCVCVWLLQLAEGLAAIHAEGIIHRDLKPANCLLLAPAAPARGKLALLDDSCGGLKIGDLGVATLRGCVGALTVVGSPAYMAPEVARGEGSTGSAGGRYDRLADIWSLGVVLVELATLVRPRLHEKPTRMLADAAAKCAEQVEAVGFSRGLRSLAHAMLALAPDQRPDALAVADAARALLAAGGWAADSGAARPLSGHGLEAKQERRRRVSAGADGGWRSSAGGCSGASCEERRGGAFAGGEQAAGSSGHAREAGCGQQQAGARGDGHARRALPAGERLHLEVGCTCQPWPPSSAAPVAGRLVLTSSLLLFQPEPDAASSGSEERQQGRPLALPLSEIVEMAVVSLGDTDSDSDGGGAIRVRAKDGSQLVLGAILSVTAVQLAVSDRILALGGASPFAPAPAQPLLNDARPPNWRGLDSARTHSAAAPDARRAPPERLARSASVGVQQHVREPGIVELGVHGIARAGADVAEACALM